MHVICNKLGIVCPSHTKQNKRKNKKAVFLHPKYNWQKQLTVATSLRICNITNLNEKKLISCINVFFQYNNKTMVLFTIMSKMKTSE